MAYIHVPRYILQEGIYLINSLTRYGHQAYFVGGCVRDVILERVPNDWDICTDATPEQVQFIVNTLNEVEMYGELYYESKGIHYNKRFLKCIPTGIQHGTVTVMIDGHSFEVTTFRKDGVYSDGRRPDKVILHNNLLEDLARRDFTMNAIAFNAVTAELKHDTRRIDPYGGFEDIQKRIIRCVGNPDDRFNEDALRILRAIRFAAQLGFTIEEKTAESIHKNKHLLKNISRERIQSELFKILMSDFCGNKVLREYADVICECIPEIKPMIGFEQNNPYHIYDVWEHTLHCMDVDFFNSSSSKWLANNLEIRLALLLHDIGKPHVYTEDENHVGHFKGHALLSAHLAESILRNLKCSNELINTVTELIKYHDTQFTPTKSSVRRLLNKIGETQLWNLIILRTADLWGHKYNAENFNKVYRFKEVLKEVLEEESCFKLKDLAINGHNLLEMGIPEGKVIGDILNELLIMVIDGEIPNEKEKLIEMVQLILEKKDEDSEGEPNV